MPKLPSLSGKELVHVLERNGFTAVRQRGSHVILVKQGQTGKRATVVPLHAELDKGTLLEILRQAGLSRNDLTRP